MFTFVLWVFGSKRIFFWLHCSWISRWPAGRASWCSFYLFILILFLLLLFFVSFRFKSVFYCWVIILHFSSFSIILFAVDLRFPIFALNMSVAVIFSFLSSMRAGHSSSMCTCVSAFCCVPVMVVTIYVQHPCSGTKYCIGFFPRQ